MTDWIHQLLPNVSKIPDQIWKASLETLYMTFATAIIAGFFGLLLGIVLIVTQEDGLKPNALIYQILDNSVNVFRSLPFIILMALAVPLTRAIVGTQIGTTAAIVPLVIGTVPFFARQVQNALIEVDKGIIEAAIAMGTKPVDIIIRVYLKEGLASLLRVAALTIISLIGLTAMAGAIGGGGLGSLAITRGYNRFQNDVTLTCTLIILLIVFISQFISNQLIKRVTH